MGMHGRLTLPVLIGLLLASPCLLAQTENPKPPPQHSGRTVGQPGEPEPQEPKTVVTATRGSQSLLDAPKGVSVLDADDLQLERQVRTLPEALREMPGVSVQKTGPAQGSPKIRGLNGFHTLFLIDGIRLNNATWRSGNVEYWNQIDPLSLERVEVMRGAGSVLYGTDAVTGTAQGLSLGPLELGPGFAAEHGALFRYGSAENSFIERLETRGHADRFGWHAGISYKGFGPFVAGDSIGEMPYTGYREEDADLKLAYATEDGHRFTFGFQHVHQPDAPRTHSTVFSKSWRSTTVGTDFLRDISQQRDLGYLRWNTGDVVGDRGLVTELTASFQSFDELENRVPSNSRRFIQETEDDQYGLQGHARWDLGSSVRATVGFDFYHEEVDSGATEFNPDGSLRRILTRGAVADNAYYDQLGAYAQAEWTLDGERRWLTTLGARYSYVEADADKVDTGSGTFAPVHDSWSTVVGSASLLYRAAEPLRFFGSVGQSFRAPNLSDLTRFDVALSGDLEIPATDLDPERFLTFELGSRFDDGLRRFEITGFYTAIDDLIQRQPTGNVVNGLVEVTKANNGDGFLTGMEFEAASRLDFLSIDGETLDAFEVYVLGDFVHSVIDAADPADARRTHLKGMPPPRGQIGLRWRDLVDDRLWFEVYVPFAAGVEPEDYNAAERRDTQRIPPDGLPGYALLGVRGGAHLGKHLSAGISVENVADRDYRIFGSGLNETGTNVVFTLKAVF
jgi:hemoglobin/transferrin/lactoferrin receptor protein